MLKFVVRIAAMACVFALVVALSGCASGGASSSASASSEAPSASASASAAAETPSSAEASSSAAQASAALPNGTYKVDVDTDSNMFHINEADEGTGVLTVSDEGMSVHIHLPSKKIVNLYAGTADEAKNDPDGVINPTTDKVTYSDGAEEEVYGFDVPVPALDQEFDVAILGSKGNWYDHKVTVSNPTEEASK